DKLLSCKNMPVLLDQIGPHAMSWQPDWANTWKEEPCNCAPATYGGMIPYFHPDHYPAEFSSFRRFRTMLVAMDKQIRVDVEAEVDHAICLTAIIGFKIPEATISLHQLSLQGTASPKTHPEQRLVGLKCLT
ncbi:unnamed protein product, partial [Mesorhabditis belari]|uniref:Uncharacterized protein n=1 Tax=Mesorhabditis belari TaxID=2138241 RepID=A0AAF3EMH9_9BILA